MSEWDRLSPLLLPALDHAGRTHDLADVAAAINERDAQFWPGTSSLLITTVDEYPKAKVLTLWLAGGDLDELRDELRPQAEAWGREQGCARSVVVGRDGWMRALRGVGYEPAAQLVMKDLIT